MSEEATQSFSHNALQIILGRLDKIESRLEKLEARAYDTKPIWENALKGIVELNGSFVELNSEFVELNGKFVELNGKVDNLRGDLDSGFRRVERKIDILNQNILEVRADSPELQERVEKLEIRPSN